MKNTFICVKIDGLQSLLQIALSGKEGLEIFLESSPGNLMNSISVVDNTELLIVDEQTITSLDLSSLEKIPVKIYFTDKGESLAGWNCFHPDDWAKAANFYLESKGSTLKPSKYANIPFSLLKSVEIPICDIFLEITRAGKPHRIKLFHANEEVDQRTIEKYLDKGIKTAAVLEEDKDQFLNSVSNKLYLKMTTAPSEKVIGQSLDASISLLKEVGFNSASTQLLEGVVDAINANLTGKRADDLKLIRGLLSSHSSRYYKKAHMTALLSCRILQMTDWGSHAHQEILSYMSLLADLSIEDPDLLFVTNHEQLDELNLNDSQKDKALTHARETFHILQDFKDKPFEVDMLILEHHGNKNGVGYSHELSSRLNKLTIIYRICEDFTVELLRLHETQAQIQIMDIFSYLYVTHDKKSLHLTIDQLKKCFVN